MSQMDKVCMVCGDKALGYNFNAVTCESCKAFFRRNALSSKDFSCPFNGTCEITVITRRFCQRCRLQKCFKIGMRKEYIMTEEDKLIKRKKVEMNRAKRKSKVSIVENDESKSIKRESDQSQLSDFWSNDSIIDPAQMDMSPGSVNSECASGYHSVASASTLSNCSMSPTSSSIGQYPAQTIPPPPPQQTHLPFPSVERPTVTTNTTINSTSVAAAAAATSATAIVSPISSTTTTTNAATTTAAAASIQYHQSMGVQQPTRIEYPTKDSNTTDIVNFFLQHSSESSNYINQLMPSQKTAMEIMTRIIHSQKDAMKMIGHLIGSPGDALKIIAKIMNSPYHALTVFTKFMASPNDALEIIAKCVNSPASVLHFLQQLMSTPDNAVDIVNRFMNEPAEAMKMLNELVDISMVDSTTKMDGNDLNNLMAAATTAVPPPPTTTSSDPSTTTIRSNEFVPSDIVNDTLFYMKSVSSPTVRNLLEAEYGEPPSQPCKMSDLKLSVPIAVEPTTADPMTDENCDNKSADDTDAINNGTSRSNSSTGNNSSSGDGGVGSGSTTNDNEHPNTLETLISNVIKIEYNCRESSISRELNDSETAKLNELIVAYKALFVPLDEDISPLVKQRSDLTKNAEKNPQDPQLLSLINLTAVAVKRMIKMVKKINAFKNMCQEDQVALLKGSCTEMMILRSIMQYDVDHSLWKIPHSQEDMSKIKSDVLKLASNNVYEEYENFIRTFDDRLRKDENIILIMSAIVLFTPSRTKIVHSDVIIMEQNSYYYLLRRYLESIYPGCEAKSLFLKLIRKIKELECLKEEMIAVYLDVNPNQVQPLLREIFDIKSS